MRENTLRTIIGSDRAVINGWCSMPSSISAETMAHQGWDSVTVDLQHGLVDYNAALEMFQAISTTPTIPMARVPWCEPGIIMKLLDAGAYGIICPMVNNRADAEKFVGAMRYAPDGYRSFGPTRAMMYAGADYPKEANTTVLAIAMIETAEALSNLDDIMSTPGLDGIYIGPSDLSLSLGCTPKLDQREEKPVAAIKEILAAAQKHKLFAGIHCLTPEYASEMVDWGFRLVTVGSDNRLLAVACGQAIGTLRGNDKIGARTLPKSDAAGGGQSAY